MRAINWFPTAFSMLIVSLVHLTPDMAWAQASPYRGLWIGSVALDSVNEVTVPLNQANVPVAPDPEKPTPTFDRADIRVIIHVNGAGQAMLLKDVAILNRAAAITTNSVIGLAEDKDLALITDPRLYAVFPPQPAMRYASAVFDFGDAKATEALDAIVEESAQQASQFVATNTYNYASQSGRVSARQDAVASMLPDLIAIRDNADVAEGFNQFILLFDTAAITDIINDPAAPVVATLTAEATLLRDRSFYGDDRALDMIEAVVAAVSNAAPADRSQAAHHTASSYADVANLYQRFISGFAMGAMIATASVEAADASQQPGATLDTIRDAILALPETVAAQTQALQAKVTMYNDTRASDAVSAVVEAIAQAAFDGSADPVSDIVLAGRQAGQSTLADMVARYPLPVVTPTLDYNAFLTASSFTGAPARAAAAAADGAIQERSLNPLYTTTSLYQAARLSAIDALRSAYGEAARVMRTELPLDGAFGPGQGDPRRTSELALPSDLGAAGLEGDIYLPASHPTNPFRHRRHPDHTLGYNIQRHIRFDFDGADGDPLALAGYGVDRITGTYREEIFGLHKPLGPDPVTEPIGLRTEGRFELNRISTIDTLNTH